MYFISTAPHRVLNIGKSYVEFLSTSYRQVPPALGNCYSTLFVSLTTNDSSDNSYVRNFHRNREFNNMQITPAISIPFDPQL